MKLSELDGLLRLLKAEFAMETFLGSTLATQGVFVLLFSHRFNQEAMIVVTGTEIEKVLSIVQKEITA